MVPWACLSYHTNAPLSWDILSHPYLFGKFSSSLNPGYPPDLCQQYRHSEFWAPTKLFARLWASKYHTVLRFIYTFSFPTRLRVSWRWKFCHTYFFNFHHLGQSLAYVRRLSKHTNVYIHESINNYYYYYKSKLLGGTCCCCCCC